MGNESSTVENQVTPAKTSKAVSGQSLLTSRKQKKKQQENLRERSCSGDLPNHGLPASEPQGGNITPVTTDGASESLSDTSAIKEDESYQAVGGSNALLAGLKSSEDVSPQTVISTSMEGSGSQFPEELRSKNLISPPSTAIQKSDVLEGCQEETDVQLPAIRNANTFAETILLEEHEERVKLYLLSDHNESSQIMEQKSNIPLPDSTPSSHLQYTQINKTLSTKQVSTFSEGNTVLDSSSASTEHEGNNLTVDTSLKEIDIERKGSVESCLSCIEKTEIKQGDMGEQIISFLPQDVKERDHFTADENKQNIRLLALGHIGPTAQSLTVGNTDGIDSQFVEDETRIPNDLTGDVDNDKYVAFADNPNFVHGSEVRHNQNRLTTYISSTEDKEKRVASENLFDTKHGNFITVLKLQSPAKKTDRKESVLSCQNKNHEEIRSITEANEPQNNVSSTDLIPEATHGTTQFLFHTAIPLKVEEEEGTLSLISEGAEQQSFNSKMAKSISSCEVIDSQTATLKPTVYLEDINYMSHSVLADASPRVEFSSSISCNSEHVEMNPMKTEFNLCEEKPCTFPEKESKVQFLSDTEISHGNKAKSGEVINSNGKKQSKSNTNHWENNSEGDSSLKYRLESGLCLDAMKSTGNLECITKEALAELSTLDFGVEEMKENENKTKERAYMENMCNFETGKNTVQEVLECSAPSKILYVTAVEIEALDQPASGVSEIVNDDPPSQNPVNLKTTKIEAVHTQNVSFPDMEGKKPNLIPFGIRAESYDVSTAVENESLDFFDESKEPHATKNELSCATSTDPVHTAEDKTCSKLLENNISSQVFGELIQVNENQFCGDHEGGNQVEYKYEIGSDMQTKALHDGSDFSGKDKGTKKEITAETVEASVITTLGNLPTDKVHSEESFLAYSKDPCKSDNEVILCKHNISSLESDTAGVPETTQPVSILLNNECQEQPGFQDNSKQVGDSNNLTRYICEDNSDDVQTIILKFPASFAPLQNNEPNQIDQNSVHLSCVDDQQDLYQCQPVKQASKQNANHPPVNGPVSNSVMQELNTEYSDVLMECLHVTDSLNQYNSNNMELQSTSEDYVARQQNYILKDVTETKVNEYNFYSQTLSEPVQLIGNSLATECEHQEACKSETCTKIESQICTNESTLGLENLSIQLVQEDLNLVDTKPTSINEQHPEKISDFSIHSSPDTISENHDPCPPEIVSEIELSVDGITTKNNLLDESTEGTTCFCELEDEKCKLKGSSFEEVPTTKIQEMLKSASTSIPVLKRVDNLTCDSDKVLDNEITETICEDTSNNKESILENAASSEPVEPFPDSQKHTELIQDTSLLELTHDSGHAIACQSEKEGNELKQNASAPQPVLQILSSVSTTDSIVLPNLTKEEDCLEINNRDTQPAAHKNESEKNIFEENAHCIKDIFERSEDLRLSENKSSLLYSTKSVQEENSLGINKSTEEQKSCQMEVATRPEAKMLHELTSTSEFGSIVLPSQDFLDSVKQNHIDNKNEQLENIFEENASDGRPSICNKEAFLEPLESLLQLPVSVVNPQENLLVLSYDNISPETCTCTSEERLDKDSEDFLKGDVTETLEKNKLDSQKLELVEQKQNETKLYLCKEILGNAEIRNEVSDSAKCAFTEELIGSCKTEDHFNICDKKQKDICSAELLNSIFDSNKGVLLISDSETPVNSKKSECTLGLHPSIEPKEHDEISSDMSTNPETVCTPLTVPEDFLSSSEQKHTICKQKACDLQNICPYPLECMSRSHVPVEDVDSRNMLKSSSYTGENQICNDELSSLPISNNEVLDKEHIALGLLDVVREKVPHQTSKDEQADIKKTDSINEISVSDAYPVTSILCESITGIEEVENILQTEHFTQFLLKDNLLELHYDSCNQKAIDYQKQDVLDEPRKDAFAIIKEKSKPICDGLDVAREHVQKTILRDDMGIETVNTELSTDCKHSESNLTTYELSAEKQFVAGGELLTTRKQDGSKAQAMKTKDCSENSAEKECSFIEYFVGTNLEFPSLKQQAELQKINSDCSIPDDNRSITQVAFLPSAAEVEAKICKFTDNQSLEVATVQEAFKEGLRDKSCPPESSYSFPIVPEQADIVATSGATDEPRDAIRVESTDVPCETVESLSPICLSNLSPAVVSSLDDVSQDSFEQTAISVSLPAASEESTCPESLLPVHLHFSPNHTYDGEQTIADVEGLQVARIRSSDSEGAFETPESTTPVKAVPQVSCDQEIQSQLPLEDTAEICSESIPEVAAPQPTEPIEEDSFCPPSRSISTVFDEDKPIASSGSYNLDFDNIDLIGPFQDCPPDLNSPEIKKPESKQHTRRKSTDSVSVPKSTLSRSLSLQAGELDAESNVSITESLAKPAEAFSIGADNASGTLKKTKKPRPPSLKKKPAVKKPVDVAPVSVNPQETQESDINTELPVLCKEVVSETASDNNTSESLKSTEKSDSPVLPQASYNFDPVNFEGIDPFSSGGSKVSVSPPVNRKSVSLTEALETASSEVGEVENSPTKGQAIRLEFDYSENKDNCETQQEKTPPPKKLGKKPGAKMPLRKPKIANKKITEKVDNTSSTSYSPSDPDITVSKGTYDFSLEKLDDPNFNPFSSSIKLQDSPKLPRQAYTFDPDTFDDSIDPFKSSSKIASSPPKSPASFQVPVNGNENCNETNGSDGENLNKSAKKKKTPIKTNTFRVKKPPKRSPLSDASSQDSTPLPTPDTPPIIAAVDHATDEEKLASSVTNQKWTCMAQDLESGNQDYPQPSDLSSFVNENSFNSSSEGLSYDQAYEIEYMEKIGSNSSHDDTAMKQSLYLKFDPLKDSPVKSSPVRLSDSPTPCSGSSFDETDLQLSGMKTQHPGSRTLAANQEAHLHSPDKLQQLEPELQSLRTASDKAELTSPEDSVASADVLLCRISRHDAMCDELEYLEPDLAEKNPAMFAQKLQEELEFAAMRIEALKLARQISQSSQCSLDSEQREVTSPGGDTISKTTLYSRTGVGESEDIDSHHHNQSDLDSALQIAREEIVTKEREVAEWKRQYEESRQEVAEMRRIVAEYEKTISQMIEDEQREKSMSHHTVQQLIMEKEQALADLNSVEKSLADLFRRYEKMKEVLEGFRKNEEVLKKCAQEYLARVKKEEQRYQALKIHAEEKLDRANAEISQVRSKAQQEQVAYQASLRKEQMKVESLERTLEQKNKEIEELTKICDELIAKMGKS
ncbi:uncharacterized protein TACC2 isoform X4 [Latimeria chalumnae]|uniref:uncharacterized protein TACC2 isoform X4 n=1 Tax=Latimeria chalumnae TaxID=7897 RepID=UPI00313E4063